MGLAQINQAQVQARVGGTCPPGQYLRGIDPDGSVVCEPVFAPTSIKTVDDPVNLVGQYTSIVSGADGLDAPQGRSALSRPMRRLRPPATANPTLTSGA